MAQKRLSGLVLASIIWLVSSIDSRACIPIVYADDGAYVGGDLAQQIASRAHTIQIVRARSRHLMTRHFTKVERYWFSRRWSEPPAGYPRAPRHRDIYVFTLEVEETLKGGGIPEDYPVLVRGIDEGRDAQIWQSLNYMVRQALTRPGEHGAAWILGAVDPESESSCYYPLSMHVGERYLVLRDEYGHVLSSQRDWGQAEFERYLPIDVAFTQQDGEQVQFAVWAPGVLRLDSSAAELAEGIRAALAE